MSVILVAEEEEQVSDICPYRSELLVLIFIDLVCLK